MGDVEDVGTAYGLVAIVVLGVDRIQIDLHVEMRARQRVRREIDGGGEFAESPLEFGARLDAGEIQMAGGGIRHIAGRRGGRRQRGHGCETDDDRQGNSSDHGRFSDLVNGNMRTNTSSLFQK